MANTIINEIIANGAIYANGFYGTGLANGVAFRTQIFTAQGLAQNSNFVDVYNLVLAGYAAAPAELFFYNYNSPDRVEIYQGNTMVANIDGAVVLTADDKAALTGNALGYFFNDSADVYLRDFSLSTVLGKEYAAYAGKIQWNHNPSLGRNYTVRTTTASGGNWRWVCRYPIDGFTVGCPPIPPNPPGDPPPIIVTLPPAKQPVIVIEPPNYIQPNISV